jgi:lipopolysaccharide/colanic/teichoic acid biosynthesis glycosyltransferase
MAAVAVAVKASSPGPVLFSQARVGRNGRSFMILKFRSMRMGSGGPLVTAGGDSRITRVGRLLRRSKVDELPQLWNVLVGDMSIVGPRPEVRRYVDLYPEDYRHILAVRPGITDYAALEYRNEEAVLAGYPDPDAAYIDVVLPAKIALYHRYLKEMSLRTDLTLILRTLGKLIQ